MYEKDIDYLIKHDVFLTACEFHTVNEMFKN